MIKEINKKVFYIYIYIYRQYGALRGVLKFGPGEETKAGSVVKAGFFWGYPQS